jgi:hypothetical protein
MATRAMREVDAVGMVGFRGDGFNFDFLFRVTFVF